MLNDVPDSILLLLLHLWHCVIIHNMIRDLEVAVDDVVDVNVRIIIPERVQQRVGNLDPAHVCDKLHDGEEWHLHVWCERGVRLPE